MTIKVIAPKKTVANRPDNHGCTFMVDEPLGPRR